MKVSRNEMNTALQRAYEGAGYAIGDYEDAAELTTWSEMCGLGGFAETEFSLPPPTADTPLVFEDQGIAVIDAGGGNPCQHGSLAAHLAASMARAWGLATVHLMHCASPKLILGSLARIAVKRFSLCAYWRDGGIQHGASFDSGAAFPDYWTSPDDTKMEPGRLPSVTVLCSIVPALLANAGRQAGIKPENEDSQTSSALLSSRYDEALNSGIEVDADQWDALNRAAWPVLVPASKQSSKGAGPG